MRILAAILVTLLSSAAFAAPPKPTVLVLDRIAVVAVFTPDSEVSESEKNGDEFADFIDDFEHYRMSIASALRGNKDVAYFDSSSTIFVFKGTEHAPVSRKSISGYGFIIYVPGKAPIIFPGVATDTDVLCELQGLAPQIRLSKQCGPNNSFKPKPLRGSA